MKSLTCAAHKLYNTVAWCSSIKMMIYKNENLKLEWHWLMPLLTASHLVCYTDKNVNLL